MALISPLGAYRHRYELKLPAIALLLPATLPVDSSYRMQWYARPVCVSALPYALNAQPLHYLAPGELSLHRPSVLDDESRQTHIFAFRVQPASPVTLAAPLASVRPVSRSAYCAQRPEHDRAPGQG